MNYSFSDFLANNDEELGNNDNNNLILNQERNTRMNWGLSERRINNNSARSGIEIPEFNSFPPPPNTLPITPPAVSPSSYLSFLDSPIFVSTPSVSSLTPFVVLFCLICSNKCLSNVFCVDSSISKSW